MRSQRGTTLGEILVITAILGMVVIALAPLEKVWLHAAVLPPDTATLDLVVDRLLADARGARSFDLLPDGGVRFDRPASPPVRWTENASGLVRDGRSYPGVRAGFSAAERRLLRAIVRDASGNTRMLAVSLRNGDRR